jgi:hypothetical protein
VRDLRALFNEWQVDSLLVIVNVFISANGIVTPGLRDAIPALLGHGSENSVTRDLFSVWDRLQEAFEKLNCQVETNGTTILNLAHAAHIQALRASRIG